MNKHHYRIIFNAARGQRMAVQETARSQGKDPGASRPARRPRANQQGMGTAARLGSVLEWNWKRAVMRTIAVGAFAQVSLVSAQIVADPSAPGNQRPTVINTANGLPQVNIQTPSAAGVSRNTYSQFDVQQKGAILNNSRSNTQTQLGGWVQGNPWLAKGSARVILNEVNSSNPSQLRGYIEVAGQRAEVVVANPAGVHIDGGGFINASRATITTGVPILNGGNLEGYRVQRGTVSIEGKGFDASLTDYTGILARAVEVNGGLWANDLHVTTGANDISSASGTTPDQAQASTPVSAEAPTFALDVAELGGMYAGKITLIGSEAGLGVRNAGTIGAQAGELIVTAEGRLENKGTIQGKTDTRLAVADGIINSGTISAGQELAVNAGQNIGNDDGTLNARRIDISAKSLTNRNGAIEQTGTQALALNGADISNRNSGSIGSTEPASEQPSEPANPGSGTGGEPGHSGNPDDPSGDGGEGNGDPQTQPTLADGNIRVETVLNNDQGKIAAATVDLTATAGLDNSGGKLGVRNLEVSGGDLINREGSLNVESLAGIHAESLNNDAGQILAAGKLDITAQDFSNRGGELQHSGKENTQFKVEGMLDNTGGVIASNAARLDVASGKLVNESGEIIHAGDAGLNIQSQVFAGAKGQIVTAGSATMQWGEADHREAKLQAWQLDLKAKALSNQAGSIAATGEGQNQIHVDDALDNSKGEIVANGSLNLNAKDVDNSSGIIASKDELEVAAIDLNNTRGTLQTENGDVRLAVENGLSNDQGQIQSGRNLAFDGQDISNTGTLYAKGDVDLQAQGHLANSGVIAAQGNVKLAGQNVTSNAESLLAAGLTSNGELGKAWQKLAIEAGQTASLQGQNLSSGDLGVGAVNINLSGSQTAAQDISLTASEAIRTAEATVSTDGTLRAEARTLDNSTGTLSADQLDLNLGSLNNRSGKVIQTGDGDTAIAMTGDLDNTSGTIASNSNNLAVKASQLVNEQGHIQHAGSGTLALDAQSLRGKAGEIVGNGQLQLNAQAADLSQGRTVAESVSIDTSSLNNSSGNIIQTGNGQTIIKASSNLANADGLIASNGDTRMDAGELINRKGQIQAAEAADLDVHAAKVLDNSQGGTIAAGGRIALDAQRVTNTSGTITAGGVAEVVAAQDIDNVGGVIASRHDLSVAASSLNNASGTIQSDNGNAALAIQGSANNDKGQIQAGRGLTLQAEDIANAGTIYAQGDATIEAKSKLENMGVIAAQGDTKLTGQNIISNAGGLLAAGLKTTGELGEARQKLAIEAGQTASLQGQNLSSGDLGVGAVNINLSGSQTAAQDISLTASEAIRTAEATVSTDGTLRAEARTLDNSTGTLSADQLDLNLGSLKNRSGKVIQTGDGDTAIAMTGDLDNTSGTIASNSNNLAVKASQLVNEQGHIQHAGSGTLALDAQSLRGKAGEIVGNGQLQLKAKKADISQGQTVAQGIGIAAAELDNSDGQLIQLGEGHALIAASTSLDNAGGIIASNGDARIDAGQIDNRKGQIQTAEAAKLVIRAENMLDNSDEGHIAAGGDAVIEAKGIDNASGQIMAAENARITATEVIGNTSGVIAGKRNLIVTATHLDNANGMLQTEDGNLELTLKDGLKNSQGQIQSAKNLTLQGHDLENDGTLYANGNTTVRVEGSLSNNGVIAALGDNQLIAQDISSREGSLLAAGLKADGELSDTAAFLDIAASNAATLQGQNLSSGQLHATAAQTLDLGGSQTAAQSIGLDANTIRTAKATVNASGLLEAHADLLDNSDGKLSADQLDLKLSQLKNRSGELIQTGQMETAVALSGDLDNTAGLIASNGKGLALSARQIVNEEGQIQHAGDGTLALEAQTLKGQQGEIVSNGKLELVAETADLSHGKTVAHSVDVATNNLNNRSGELIQLGQGQARIKVSAELNNAEGIIASNGDTRMDAGQILNGNNGQIQATGAATLDIHATQSLNNSEGGSIESGGNTLVEADSLVNDGGRITAGQSANVTTRHDINNSDGVIASRSHLRVEAQSLNNASGTLQSETGSAALEVFGTVNNDQGKIQASKDLLLQAHDLVNTGTVYAEGDATVVAQKKLENAGVIASKGDARISGENISSSADSLLAAGLGTNGRLGEEEHELTVQTGQAARLQGQNLSSGQLRVEGSRVDLNESLTAAKDIVLKASDAIGTSGATVNATGTLQADAQSLDNSSGSLSADQLDLNLKSLNNRSGKVSQTGNGDTTIAMTGDLDNTSGTIAANSNNLTLKTATLENAQGSIQHAGSATLALDVQTLQGQAGEIVSNGQLQLKAQTANLAQANTVAQRLNVDTAELNNRGGQLIQAGKGQSFIKAITSLDNAGGTIASNGDTRMDAGQINNRNGQIQTAESAKLEIRTTQTLDNSEKGNISAGGDAVIEAHHLTNADGQIIAGQKATVTVEETVDNTNGIIASRGDLTVTATDLDNTSGTLQADDGDIKLTVRNGTSNDKGRIQSGKDFNLAGQDVDNTGTLYAKGNATVKASGNLSNHGVIAAQGNTRLTGQSITSGAEGLLAAGLMADGRLSQTQESHLEMTADKTAALQGQNLSSGELSIDAGDIDIGSSQTAAKDIRLTAGDALRATSATVSASGIFQADAKSLDNSAGTISADQLDLKLGSLNNRDGKLIQTGKGDTAIELNGDLDNTSGSIAANSDNLTLKAARLINEQGHIQHAGQETLALQAQTLKGKGGEVVSNGQLPLKAQEADLSQADTVAQRLDVDTAKLDNRGGQLIQAGNGQASIKASASLDNAGGTIASNGDTRMDVGQIGNSNGHIQTAENASLDLRAAKTLDNSQQGSIAAGGDARIAAASVTNAAGQITAGKAAQVTADQSIDNTGGTLASKGDLTAKAASLNNVGGTVASVEGDATLTVQQKIVNQKGRIEAKDALALTSGELDNTGGSIAASDVSVDTQKALYNNGDGTLLASNTLAIDSGKLINAKGGLIQAGKHLEIDTNGQALENHAGQPDGGIYSQGTADIATGDLLNQGAIGSQEALSISAKSLSNTDGAGLTSADTLTIRADDVTNQGGSIIESLGNLAIQATDKLDNTGSLVRSSGKTTLSAAQIANADTLGEGQGIEGQSVSVTADVIDNRSGAIRANDEVRIVSSKALDNSSGRIEAGGTLSIAGDATNELEFTNTEGTLIAGKRLELSVSKLEGGKVLSQGDLALNLRGDYTQAAQSELKADGDLSLSTTGTLTNQGQLQAGENVELTAKHIDNTATGEISSGNTTTLNGSDRVTNRGLIDGVNTRIHTNVLDNAGTGRIYGDNIGIEAQEVVNREEYSTDGQRQSATIAAREQLDIGARNIQNKEGSLILSTGDLAIGQTLDEMGHATGQADLVHNASATIESGRDMTIAATTIRNSNEHFATETQQGETVTKRVIRVGGQTFDPSEVMYVHYDSRWRTSNFFFTSDDSWVKRSNDDSYYYAKRLLVTASEKYPFEVYGAESFPVGSITEAYGPSTGDDSPERLPDVYLSRNSPLWDLFGVAKPNSDAPEQRSCADDNGINDNCMRPFNNWLSENKSKYLELNKRLEEFKRDVDSRNIREWVMEKYDETSSQTVVTQSDPGRIVAGGNAKFNGAVINDKSQIQAGAALTVNGPDIQNIEAEGTIETRRVGQSVHTNLDDGGNGREREFQSSNIDITLPPQTISLPVTQIQQGTSVQSSGQQAGKLGAIASVNDQATQAEQAKADVPTGTIVEVEAKVQATKAANGTTANATSSAQAEVQSDAIAANAKIQTPSAAENSSVDQAKSAKTDAQLDVISIGTEVQTPSAAEGSSVEQASATQMDTRSEAVTAGAVVQAPKGIENSTVDEARAENILVKTDAIKTQSTPETPQQAEDAKAKTVHANDVSHKAQAIEDGGATDANAQAPSVIRTVTPSGNLPTASLFAQNPESSANYLIETDPRFTNSKQWLSSDYMLDQLGSDPALLQKRLGDGYYEQRLIREQIGQLTGLRYLQGYASDEVQYQSLMNAGVTFGKEYGLVPGVALTSAQMAQLTSDIVWLVEKQVTLADGSVQTVLAPQVYVRVQDGDLKGDGTLMAAENLDLNLSGDLSNSGTLAARKIVKVDADNIRNIGGTVSGQDVSLAASTDLENIGGSIAAQNSLSATAGRDLTVASTTSDGVDAAGSLNGIDRVASLYVGSSAGAGTLVASAGRDLSLTAANVVNDSTSDSALTLLNAGRDLQLKTEAIGQEHTAEWGKNNWRRDSQSTEIGSTVKAAGDVQLQAGEDIGMRAADIASDNAAITAIAGRDLKIEAGESSQGYAEAHQVKSGGFLSKKTIKTFNSQDNTQAEGSTLSAEKINLQAGRDVSVNASDVVATQDVNISAGRDVSISAGHDTQTEAHERQVKKSGLFGSGMGFTIGSQKTSTAMRTTQETAAASTIGSVEGNVNIQAGRDYSQVGSDVLSPKGDISIGAQNIAITEVREASRSEQETKFKQSGLSVSVSAPVISALQTAVQMKQAAGKTDDTRMQALAAGAAGLNAFTSGAVGSAANLANATNATDAAKAANVSVSITVGSSKSQNNVTQTTDQAAGSKVQAGGDVTLVATGDAANPGHANSGNILVQGSDISAGQNATLAASNQIDLQSAQQLAEQHSSNKSSSAAVGVAISYGTNGLAGGITANASAARGKADGNDVVHSNSHIEAGNTATLVSGGDTNIRGAQVQGKQVIADVGGDLNIQSQQDTSVYKSKQTSVGGGITVGAGVAGSASYANSKVKGDYASVTEQSGIQAGDKGFQIDVGGNTDLQGAVIASNQTAIDNNADSLTTGTLTASDIENHSDYKASGVSLSGGYAVGGGDGGSKGKSDSSTTGADSNTQASSTVGNGANWSWQNFNGQTGVTGAGAGYSQESGSDSSTTRSGISAGTVTVTDEAGQQKKAGKTADEVLANVNRNVLSGDNANSLSKNWDAEKLREQVQAQAKIVATFGETASKAVGDYAQQKLNEAQALRGQAINDPAQAEQLNAQADQLESQWGESGSLRILAHSTIGALTGGVQGAAGAAAGTLTAPTVANALAQAGIDESLANTLTAIASTTVGAAAGGASGAAAGLNEVANNYLNHKQWNELAKKLQACKSETECNAIQEEYAKLSQKQDAALATCDARGDCVQLAKELEGGNDALMDLVGDGKLPIGYAGAANLQYMGERLASNATLRKQVGESVNYMAWCGENPDACRSDQLKKAMGPGALVLAPFIAAHPELVYAALTAQHGQRTTSAAIGAAVNAGAQLATGSLDEFSEVDVMVAAATAYASSGMGLAGTVGVNTAGSVAGDLTKGTNFNELTQNAWLTAGGSVLGYSLGGLVRNKFDQWLNPVRNRYLTAVKTLKLNDNQMPIILEVPVGASITPSLWGNAVGSIVQESIPKLYKSERQDLIK